MRLTATQIRNLKPRANHYKAGDAGGIHLLVRSNGARWRRWTYRHLGNEKPLMPGTHPDVSLTDGVERREEARR